MYKYFKVKNFRCFQELEFDDLARVNLIAGVNNIGKTTLLEAIFLHGGNDPKLTIVINALRGFGRMGFTVGTWIEHPMDSLFHQFDVSKEIELVSEDAAGGHRSIKLRAVGESLTIAEAPQEADAAIEKSDIGGGLSSSSSSGSLEVAKVLELEHEEAGKSNIYRMIMNAKGVQIEPLPPDPPFQSFLLGAGMSLSLSDQAILYGNLEVRREQDQVLRILRIIEPRLQDIRNIKSILHADIGTPRLMPLPLMGGGMVRLANLAMNIGNAPNGVVLVDEIENGFHHSVMPKIWKAIAVAARESNTQIFATTHSYECIEAAHNAFTLDGTYDFRLHRLGRLDGKIRAVTYDQETINAALEAELEVR